MKKFKLSPYKNFKFTVNVNDGFAYWYDLLNTLMAADVFAPMLIMLGYLDLVTDTGCPKFPTPYAQSYAWIGELMADAEHEEIGLAARTTGLLAQGLNDFVLFALSSRERKQAYAGALAEIISSGMAEQLVPEVRTLCESELRSV